MKKFLFHLKKEKGIALLMVLTAVTILTLILGEFTIETKVNKLKVYNIQDREQARLNAESGLKFAIAKLRLYKEGYNLLQKNSGAQGIISAQKLENLMTEPFALPITLSKSANIIQKTAAEEFSKNSLVRGSFFVEMTPVSGFLNPNALRIPAQTPEEIQNPTPANPHDENNLPPHAIIEKQFTETLTEAWKKRRETDEEFNNQYGNLNIKNLVSELKLFVNSKGVELAPEEAELESLYTNKNITPKHAPLSSFSEMYLLLGWPDAIVDLIKDQMSVHEVTIIPLNKITKEQLRLIFPNSTEEQLTDFFKERDGFVGNKNTHEESKDPHPFESEEEFKNLVVGKLNMATDQGYSDRIKELEKAGYKLGIAGKLFKVISTGEYERGKYTIVAYLDLPIKEVPKKPKKNPSSESAPMDAPTPEPTPTVADPAKKPTLELLDPRIVEIRTY